MSGRHHSIVGTGPLSSANPLPPPPSVHPPSLSHQQAHSHAGYHPHHQSPASINAKAQSRPPTGRSPMMRGAAAGNGGPPGGGANAAEREREAYYRSEAYLRDREVREREKERERERDRERERGRDRDRERERERDPRDRMRERDREHGRDREQVARSQQHQQQQQQQHHINGHGPPPYHPNGHPMSHSGPTTRHPLDMSHGHPNSHLPPPPQPSGLSSGIDRRDSRNHPPPPLPPHHHHHQVQNMRTSSMGPNSQAMTGPSGGPAGLTAAQVTTAIVKGTEGPLQALAQANEQTWLLIGAVSEQLSDTTRALVAYENALRHNPMSVSALTQVAGIARSKEEFSKAIDYYQRTLNISPENGEVWGSLGHCYLMTDDLQKAYTAYQQALYRLPNPKDSKLWYGIGILYDRYGSLEHAEEAFSSVLRMEPDFEKANEIYFRLGIIYKQQHKYPASLDCFRYILGHPPRPLTEVDIWFQIGHVYEQQKDYGAAKDAYERVLKDSPNHAKVLQQLGWLYHQGGASFANQDLAISYLTKSLEADPADPQSWYLLGRAFMGGQKFNKAYEAYQQAVYRDGRNPTFWCSIGVLYYQINQYRDALDAYSRAIRLNPFISEVWFDLGSLYESCNNQVNDAIDAYARASDLDPTNLTIKGRLSLLKNAQRDGQPLPPPPPPQDVHPTAYASTVPGGRFPGQGGPGGQPPYEGPSAGAGPDGQPILTGRDLAAPPPPHMASLQESAFRGGGPPPPLQLDDVRNPAVQRTPLAPMTVDRTPNNEAAHSRAQSQAHAGPGPDGHDRRRGGRMSPPPSQLRGEGRSVGGSHPDPNGWDPYYRRDVGDDRDPRDLRGGRIDKLSGPAGPASLRGSPAPSAVRGSPSVMRSYPAAPSPWDARHELGDRRTPMQDNADRRVSGGSEYRQAGPLNGLGKRGSISQLPHPEDTRAGSQSRPGSPGRYAADDKYRSDRAYRESDARARDDLERRPRYSPEPPTSASLLTRPDASSMQSPASAHSVAVPESTKKKRGKGRATSPDKQSPRTAAFPREKKTAVETLNTPLPLRHADESDIRSQAARSRPVSPANVPGVAGAKSAATAAAPRPSGRIIDEDYDEGAADALMGLAGYKGTKEANGTSYIPIARAVSEARTEAAPAPKKLEATQGHKRAISSTEDAIDSDAKKARLGSPEREKAKSVKSPSPAKSVTEPAPAAATPAVPEPAADKAKETAVAPAEVEKVVQAPSPKSPEPGVITEAVSGNSIAVQGPPAVLEAEKPKEKTPTAMEGVEKPAAADSSATADKDGGSVVVPPIAESATSPAKPAEEPSATPMEVETK